MKKVKELFSLIYPTDKTIWLKYFLAGFASMIFLLSLQRISDAILMQSSIMQIHSIFLAENFFIFDLLAIFNGLLTFVLLYRNKEEEVQIAYLPLLFHYAVIFTATFSNTPQWKVGANSLNADPTVASQKILLRFEFHRQNNRVQLWAYALDLENAYKRRLLQLNFDDNFDLYLPQRTVRKVPMEVENSAEFQDDLFVACPALSNPSDFYLSTDYFKGFNTNEKMELRNSVQLILDGIDDANKCYYFLQVNTEKNFDVNSEENSKLKNVWLCFYGFIFAIIMAFTFASVKIFWEKIGSPIFQRRKLKRQRIAEAHRLEQKLRTCNSFFSMETALAMSMSAGSTVDDELDSFHNKCHFSAII